MTEKLSKGKRKSIKVVFSSLYVLLSSLIPSRITGDLFNTHLTSKKIVCDRSRSTLSNDKAGLSQFSHHEGASRTGMGSGNRWWHWPETEAVCGPAPESLAIFAQYCSQQAKSDGPALQKLSLQAIFLLKVAWNEQLDV